MIADISITEKSFGDKSLFSGVQFSVADGEKVGVIGRNGIGKSTLFGILAGTDKDYQGDVIYRAGTVVVATAQEHHETGAQTVLDYVLQGLPEYAGLHHVITNHPDSMGDDMRKITEYTNALQRFGDLGFYQIEEQISRELANLQLPEGAAEQQFSSLSGGQKRLVEVVKVMHSKAHLALIDEPTNHMDFVAKGTFIDWMREAPEAMLIITHDRDVLAQVDRIIEIKDGKAVSFKGNYDKYLSQNARDTSNQMNEHEQIQRKIENLKDKVVQFRRLKEKARDPDTIKQFKRRESQASAELAQLQAVKKPTFWIDKLSVEGLGLKTGAQYEKFKARNIKIQGARDREGHSRLLLEAKSLSLGYEAALFKGVSFQLREGEVLELRGRNGAGKTTLIKVLLAYVAGTPLPAKVYDGYIEADSRLTIGIYEQEVAQNLFDMTLSQAIETIYLSRNLSITGTRVRQLLADYLFTMGDADVPVRLLSGGQKARIQLIDMLAGNPQMLILDEPTNHLDLPSIEELENALASFKGAIMYVSHDSYFREKLGGEVLTIA